MTRVHTTQDSISLNPDTLLEITLRVLDIERGMK